MGLPLPIENLRLRIMAAWRERAVSLKAASFAFVGLINTAVDATVFFLLLGFVTSSLIVANVGGWLVAVTGVMSVGTLARQTMITATCGLGLLSEPAAVS